MKLEHVAKTFVILFTDEELEGICRDLLHHGDEYPLTDASLEFLNQFRDENR